MAILILVETSAGYALFKGDKAVLKASPEQIPAMLKLKRFEKFDSAASALEEAESIINSRVSDKLANLLAGEKGKLAVADSKLGVSIYKHPALDFKLISDSTTLDVHRAIRENLLDLLPGLTDQDMRTMNLGLSHSLSRHRLKFSPDKIDTMIIQAISLLDDLDKEINVYVMRLKEWYGWHFPEMARIVTDGNVFSKVVLKMGMRTDAHKTDFSDLLTEDMEAELKAAAEISMGTEIAADDLHHIQHLATQTTALAAYRVQLSSYLSARMTAIAPNLSALVGDLVGARLISHAGSLMSLAKAPASTIQILGAEKALFRALKTKHDTPKYGLIFHASLIGQASTKSKGKIARLLATKTALSVRVDALADDDNGAAIGIDGRTKVEARLQALDGIQPRSSVQVSQEKFVPRPVKTYNTDTDALMAQREEMVLDQAEEEGVSVEPSTKRKMDEDDANSILENGDEKSERKRRKREEKEAKRARKEEKRRKKDE